MASITDPQHDSFRLSQLIYDTRYRSMTIQFVALVGFMLFAAGAGGIALAGYVLGGVAMLVRKRVRRDA